jgi:hypothetical protein
VTYASGAIGFYDYRASQWLPTHLDPILPVLSRVTWNHPARGGLAAQGVLPTIFTHQWEPDGHRLFVGGGSLFANEDYSFAALYM